MLGSGPVLQDRSDFLLGQARLFTLQALEAFAKRSHSIESLRDVPCPSISRSCCPHQFKFSLFLFGPMHWVQKALSSRLKDPAEWDAIVWSTEFLWDGLDEDAACLMRTSFWNVGEVISWEAELRETASPEGADEDSILLLGPLRLTPPSPMLICTDEVESRPECT